MLDQGGLWLSPTLKKWAAPTEIPNPSKPHRMRKLNIYILNPACFYRDYEGEKNDTIKLTSLPFHVWKEVIIELYPADSTRPVMTEGWTEQFLCAHIAVLRTLWNKDLKTDEAA